VREKERNRRILEKSAGTKKEERAVQKETSVELLQGEGAWRRIGEAWQCSGE